MRARSAKIWSLVSLFMTTLLSLLPLAGVGQQEARSLALLYLPIWYFAAGRPQARYVVVAVVVAMTVVAVGGLVGPG